MLTQLMIPALLLFGIGFVTGCGGGTTSPAAPPIVSTPPPVADISISATQPNTAYVGDGPLQLAVGGAGFTSNSVVQWNGTALPTTYSGNTLIYAQVGQPLLAQPGAVKLAVVDSGTTSNMVVFPIQPLAAKTAGVVQLISAAVDGSEANGAVSVAPSISDTGRYVAFQSDATNLQGAVATQFAEIYLRDTCIGAPTGCVPSTQRVSVTADGSPLNYPARETSVSADGRFVVFDSNATNVLPLSAGCAPSVCLYLRDTCNGASSACMPKTTFISWTTSGPAAGYPWISPDGRFVIFSGGQTFTEEGSQIYVYDSCFGAPAGCTSQTIEVSLNSSGQVGNQASYSPQITPDGRFAAFASFATNFNPPPQPGTQSGAWVRDTCTGVLGLCTLSLLRADVANDGTPNNGDADYNYAVDISATGRFVAFTTDLKSTNLSSQNLNGQGQVFLRDTCIGVTAACTTSTTLLSVGYDGSVGNGGSSDQSMDRSGRYVVFSTLSNNLVPFTNFAMGFGEVLARDTCAGAPAGCVPSTFRLATMAGSGGQPANYFSETPRISGDGHYVVFISPANSLLPGLPYTNFVQVFIGKTGF